MGSMGPMVWKGINDVKSKSYGKGETYGKMKAWKRTRDMKNETNGI